MLHVLLIGAGTMGNVHGEAFANMENAVLSGIVDKDLEKAGKLAEKLQTTAFQTFEEAIETLKKVDVVSICLPTPFHKPFLKIAADQGLHVICEKPLARNLVDAREMIDYCKEKDVKLFVGHVVRFFPEYVRAKKMIEEGTIGNTAVVRTYRGGGFPNGSDDWYADYEKSGGLVLDMIIHDFDFLRWCFGEVERVYAKSIKNGILKRIDYSLVTLRFKNGVIAHVEGSWAHQSFTTRFEFAGQSGIIEHDSSKSVPVLFEGRKKSTSGGGVAVPESPLKDNPYFMELAHFIHCIETGKAPIVTAEDAYKAMEIALSALKSIETGREVVINENQKEEAQIR
ncbi:Gfo/Idh/MocA family protein [Neobacillus cucumis]|uniref:Gfo/Idh/MocA family oxidoreductase n=1 Tax=Neobacillus cucumis TaxID=1740721 RepID=A0A2N5HVV7_9BACI|nr:Gfo/Idh/MocA family oxidoreductase [Neobacillus cucumis]PLS09655.1 gfo/Idh/MocA family oxidoreductase [Neobacillus cucumis]